MKTPKDCKKIISKLGFKLGVSPNLIITRLLDDHDKVNMIAADLSIESLIVNIEVWRDNGMPDYAHGHSQRLEQENQQLKAVEKPKFIPGKSYMEYRKLRETNEHR